MKSSISRSNSRLTEENKFIPRKQDVQPAEAEMLDQYMDDLQKYFIHGRSPNGSERGAILPLKMAARQQTGAISRELPLFYSEREERLLPLSNLLEVLLEKYLPEALATAFKKDLPGTLVNIQEQLRKEGNDLDVHRWINALVDSWQFQEDSAVREAGFSEKMQVLRDNLLKQLSTLFGASGRSVFQLLSLQSKLKREAKGEFLKTLKSVSTGLNELLLLEGKAPELTIGKLDFAEDLISFEKIQDVALDNVSSHLPDSLISRVKWARRVLSEAQENHLTNHFTLVTTQRIKDSLDLESIFGGASIKIVEENACAWASTYARERTKDFVAVIAALRMGKLMIEQKYKEHLHNDYFDDFDLDHLSASDLQYFPTILIIEEARKLMDHSNDLLELLGNNSFVNVLGINYLGDLFKVEKQPSSDYLELASLAIFKRNSYVFQGGADQLPKLQNAFQKGLSFPGAAFWNVLLPDISNQTAQYSLTAAIESRVFPRIEYAADGNHFAFQQINLQDNPDPEATFSSFEQATAYASSVKSEEYAFTIADFFTLNADLTADLEVIPPEYQSTNLIPLAAYLAEAQDSIQGKLPFLWMVDEGGILRQVLIPIQWVQYCRTRLEYWDFLQSIAGINKANFQAKVDELKKGWEEEKNIALAELKASLEQQFEAERSKVLEQGISQMLFGLLEEDQLEATLKGISQTAAQTVPLAQAAQDSSEEEEKAPKEEIPTAPQLTREEAWVESDECTSCKDCIVAVPAVFKYNEDRQAYVYDPRGASFAQIVAAAEKCPARCIHPGVPQNKDEPSLDKWIKRAEKFN